MHSPPCEQAPDAQSEGASEPVRVVTLGCRLNAYESEVMRGHAAAAGLDGAVIVNTCAVTAEAVRQAAIRVERELIVKALEQTGGNVTHTARLLKISRKSLQTKMKELGLREPKEE